MAPFAAAQAPTDGVDDALSNPIVEELQDQTTETVAAIEPGRDAPDLAVAITPPSITQSETATLRIRIGNGGGPADAFWADVFDGEGERLHEEYVKSLGRDAHHEFTVDVPLSPGRNAFHVTVDDDRAIIERNETNNEDATWVLRRHTQPLDVPHPVVLETPSGYLKPIQGFENRLAHAQKQLVLPPTQEGGTWLIHQQWLESRLPDVAVEDANLSIRERSGATYLATPAAASNATTVLTLNQFDLARPTKTGAYGFGSPTTVLLDERPMRVRLVETPKDPGVHADNNPLPQARVTIDFQDDDHSGQGVWVNASWLAGFGIRQPAFAHEDGSRIPFENHGGYYLVQAGHFSMIHVFNAGPEVFERVYDADHASVMWNVYGSNLRIRSNNCGWTDESMARDFIVPSEFTLSARITAVEQGMQSQAYPLALGERSDWAGQWSSDEDRDTMGFEYYSNQEGTTEPEIRAFKAQGGSRTTLWTWDTTESPTHLTNPYEGWEATLQIRKTADSTYFELLDSDGDVDRSHAVSNANLPWPAIDSILVAANSVSGWGCTASTWLDVDDIAVDVLRGNFVSYAFDSTDWNSRLVSDGHALVRNGVLDLTYSSAGSVGRAFHEACTSVNKFSAQFDFHKGPESSGWGGLVFHFWKTMEYAPAAGGRMGFEDWDEAASSPHAGYGVEFDGHTNPEFADPDLPSIGLIKDKVSNHLTTVGLLGAAGDGWNAVNIEATGGAIYVYLNGVLMLADEMSLDRTHRCFGLSAGVGDDPVNIKIDDLHISTVPPNQSPTAANTPSPATGATDTGRRPVVSWTPATDPEGDVIKYRVLVSQQATPTVADATFVGACDAWRTSTSCQLPLLDATTTYYWQVLTSDGLTVTPSSVWSFTTIANLPPNVPSNPYPADGAVNHDYPAKLTWGGGDPDGDAVEYMVYVGKSNPPNILTDCGRWSFSQQSTECAADLDYNSTYYWRVRARDANSNVLGPVWSFNLAASTENHPPRAPTGLYPKTTGFDPAGGYGQEADMRADTTDKDGDNLLHTFYVRPVGDAFWWSKCRDVPESVCDPGRLAPGTAYEWKVAATDGAETVESEVETFWTRAASFPSDPPSSPVPADGAVSQPNLATLRFTEKDIDGGPVRFTFVLDTQDPPKANQLLDCVEIKATRCTTPWLVDGETYYWQVVAFDGAVAVPGPVWSFTVGVNMPPYPPTDPTPAIDAASEAAVVDLAWAASDPEGHALTFDVFVAKGSTKAAPQRVCESVAEPACTFSGQYSATYFWFVIASDGHLSMTGPVWTYATRASTVNHGPGAPTPLFPIDEFDLPERIRFIWEAVDDVDNDAVTYSVWRRSVDSEGVITIGDGADGSWEKVCSNVGRTWCDSDERYFADGVTYEWYVKAHDGEMWSSASETARFSVRFGLYGGLVDDRCWDAVSSGPGIPVVTWAGDGRVEVIAPGSEDTWMARNFMQWRAASECMAAEAPGTLPDVKYEFMVNGVVEGDPYVMPLGVPLVADWDDNGFFGTLVHLAPSPTGLTGGFSGSVDIYREIGLLEDISDLEEARLRITIDGVPGSFEIATYQGHTNLMKFTVSTTGTSSAATTHLQAEHAHMPGSWLNVTRSAGQAFYELRVMDGIENPQDIIRHNVGTLQTRLYGPSPTAAVLDEWSIKIREEKATGNYYAHLTWDSPTVRTVKFAVTNEAFDVEGEVGATPEHVVLAVQNWEPEQPANCAVLTDAHAIVTRFPCIRTRFDWEDASRPIPWMHLQVSNVLGANAPVAGPLDVTAYDLAPYGHLFVQAFTGTTSEGTNPEERFFLQVQAENQVREGDGWVRENQLLDIRMPIQVEPSGVGPFPPGAYDLRLTDVTGEFLLTIDYAAKAQATSCTGEPGASLNFGIDVNKGSVGEALLDYGGTRMLAADQLVSAAFRIKDGGCRYEGEVGLGRDGLFVLSLNPDILGLSGLEPMLLQLTAGDVFDRYTTRVTWDELKVTDEILMTVGVVSGAGDAIALSRFFASYGAAEVTAVRLQGMTLRFPQDGVVPLTATVLFDTRLGGGINIAPFNPRLLLCNPECDTTDGDYVKVGSQMRAIRTLEIGFDGGFDGGWEIDFGIKIANNPTEQPQFSPIISAYLDAWIDIEVSFEFYFVDPPTPTASAFTYRTRLIGPTLFCGADDVCWDKEVELRSGDSETHSQLFGGPELKLRVRNLVGEETPEDLKRSVDDGTVDERLQDMAADAGDEHGP